MLLYIVPTMVTTKDSKTFWILTKKSCFFKINLISLFFSQFWRHGWPLHRLQPSQFGGNFLLLSNANLQRPWSWKEEEESQEISSKTGFNPVLNLCWRKQTNLKAPLGKNNVSVQCRCNLNPVWKQSFFVSDWNA